MANSATLRAWTASWLRASWVLCSPMSFLVSTSWINVVISCSLHPHRTRYCHHRKHYPLMGSLSFDFLGLIGSSSVLSTSNPNIAGWHKWPLAAVCWLHSAWPGSASVVDAGCCFLATSVGQRCHFNLDCWEEVTSEKYWSSFAPVCFA